MFIAGLGHELWVLQPTATGSYQLAWGWAEEYIFKASTTCKINFNGSNS